MLHTKNIKSLKSRIDVSKTKETVLSNSVAVTGAAGFIGGQTMIALRAAGYKVLGIDKARLPANLKDYADYFMQEDYASSYALDAIYRHQPLAIIHCGGTSLVGPSMKDPAGYYHNNFVKTKTLLDHVVKQRLKSKIIFSSSAAVYGEPDHVPCAESDVPAPVSPYGDSKFMIEMMLRSYGRAYGLSWNAFRYFNVCGADPKAQHGQRDGATHIIARILESIRDGREFVLNGDDYDTEDGSCIRDYVHVADVAAVHVRALNTDFVNGVYNVGINQGISNREIMDATERITGQKLKITVGPRRPGDPARLQADAGQLEAQGWQAQHGLDDMVTHAWKWYVR
jgi:UDP-glucose-4-epimerase GalE